VKQQPGGLASPTFLGLDCGGTQTVAILADADGRLIERTVVGPANARLLSDAELAARFKELAAQFPAPAALGIGMAGVREEQDRRRVRRAAARAWPGVPLFAGNDLEIGLAAADQTPGAQKDAPARPRAQPQARVLVISGTGSCCYGRAATGATAKAGGWGHLLGDRGSGYEIGLRALQAVLRQSDRLGVWPLLGQQVLRRLQLNEPNDLVDWAQKASKAEVAALALEVFAAWEHDDPLAAAILRGAADTLAADAAACARRLAKPSARVEFVLAGSVLLKQPSFAQMVTRRLGRLRPGAVVKPMPREGAWGAVALARQAWLAQRATPASPPGGGKGQVAVPTAFDAQPVPATSYFDAGQRQAADSEREFPLPQATGLSPTEQRNPRSMDLDKQPLAEAIELMLREDARIPEALLAERAKLERGLRLIIRAFRRGGRLFYVGAGTSGRLGVLDASECPATFSVSPDMVQGIIAGGPTALWLPSEGAEDDAEGGARAMRGRGVGAKDVVVGIAASGRTPFVWGALLMAKRLGAATILLCFNPRLKFARPARPTLVICPAVGPEILTGSTRLKAGTATKLILNLFTTLAMTRLGKVASNLMVDVNPANEKLRERATRILCELSGVQAEVARAALERSGWVLKTAWRQLRRRLRVEG
jgi:N-acetylmuramic acid 6-phosphate etherase